MWGPASSPVPTLLGALSCASALAVSAGPAPSCPWGLLTYALCAAEQSYCTEVLVRREGGTPGQVGAWRWALPSWPRSLRLGRGLVRRGRRVWGWRAALCVCVCWGWRGTMKETANRTQQLLPAPARESGLRTQGHRDRAALPPPGDLLSPQSRAGREPAGSRQAEQRQWARGQHSPHTSFHLLLPRGFLSCVGLGFGLGVFCIC